MKTKKKKHGYLSIEAILALSLIVTFGIFIILRFNSSGNNGMNIATNYINDTYKEDDIPSTGGPGGGQTGGGGSVLPPLNPDAVYNVFYNAKGGTLSGSYQTTYISKVGIQTLPTPTKSGYKFLGWIEPSNPNIYVSQIPAGTHGDVMLEAKYDDDFVNNEVNHYICGLRGGEGDFNNGECLKFENTILKNKIGQSFQLSSTQFVTPPKGFETTNKLITSSIGGVEQTLDLPVYLGQGSTPMVFNFLYNPIEYDIAYNLAGGTQAIGNPTTYNILYGKKLLNPTKPNYTFAGWELNGKKVTGINEGKNASFTSKDQMINELNSRTSGNITLVATWTAK